MDAKEEIVMVVALIRNTMLFQLTMNNETHAKFRDNEDTPPLRSNVNLVYKLIALCRIGIIFWTESVN